MTRLLAALALVLTACAAQAETLKLAVTTSFAASGLPDVLLPALKLGTGIDVELMVGDTENTLAWGEAGQVDALLIQGQRDEETFVAAGFGTHCRKIMYDDFVLLGPIDDYAGIAQSVSVTEALQRIAKSERQFVSMDDDSDLHKKEQALWADAGLMPQQFPNWYAMANAGPKADLTAAVDREGYILMDRQSWLQFGGKTELALLFSGDPVLFNQYTFVPVNPERHPHVARDLADRVERWLTGAQAAELINGYTIEGQPLFTFNAE
ncbi:substrate-binding domain-containing protein [Pseudosulfitobacter pseudonitzschiae]|uniref:substrate-binding domain-containing protein n=1 Tax=Pseudosulfitobacter pseudonitzschiae TaxID=1402135 RepID=UPI001AF4CF87|nr:substrate-binding domain-containing protein [Pseudosulfitobacter pseudonitzschiae]MBM1816421.1 substrate-binding domain-containing protein [Pseudosulfitobacter pseudonitzschiae]MBM1833019.1 substrate-binding domain-containing protein [Pseudosulfitobacter pseudonitzschiae]MBM1837887.1 substrate-binding domain-containing protein [Pseudosulfitobacter pseudonitzschiae]MBM1843148.1 substrate-binding domain-containing protein [Pseudosulfitobacter pseudonitzschiae]MBM1848014.1 substrate-binding do